MADDREILKEIRDLLRLIAEPALAKRDERMRTALQEIVGKSKRKADAVLLMNGTRQQSEIRKLCGIDMGDLSRLVKALRTTGLIDTDDKHPKLLIYLPPNFSFSDAG
jgi:hypothetical protein